MKNYMLIIFLLTQSVFYAQENDNRWYSTADLELIIPSKVEYDYSVNNVGSSVELDTKIALGVLYTLNYKLFRKFSVGAITGIQSQYGPDFFMFKLGANLKYFFVDENNVYVYLQDAHNFSFDKEKFKEGNNFWIGIGFPVLKRDGFNINTNVFYEQNYLDLHGSRPLVFGSENPSVIYFNSIGISLGAQF